MLSEFFPTEEYGRCGIKSWKLFDCETQSGHEPPSGCTPSDLASTHVDTRSRFTTIEQ